MNSAHSIASRAALAVGLMIGFYTLALGVASLLLYFCYAQLVYIEGIHPRILLPCLIGGLTILWSILPRIDRFKAPGPVIEPDRQPRLFEEIESIAAETGQPMPREVFLVGDVNAWVAQRGGMMGFFSRRVMGLGLPLMQTLSVSEFRAVIAHEFGHYHHGDTRLGPWIYKTRAAIGRTIANLGGSKLQAPFRWYGTKFLEITQAVSRRQELNADALACRLMGSRPLIEGLKKIQAAAPAYDEYWQGTVAPILSSGFHPPIAEGFRRFTGEEQVARAMTGLLEKGLKEAKSNPYDTHPPLPERIAAVSDLPAGPDTPGAPPALSLLSDVPGMERSWIASLVPPTQTIVLKPIAWEEMASRIMIPVWRKAVEGNTAALEGGTVGGLAEVLAEAEARGRHLELPAGIPDNELARAESFRGLAGVAVVMALERAGWTIQMSPGAPVVAQRGEDRLEPFEIVRSIARGTLSPDAWRDQTASLGVQNLPLPGWSGG